MSQLLDVLKKWREEGKDYSRFATDSDLEDLEKRLGELFCNNCPEGGCHSGVFDDE